MTTITLPRATVEQALEALETCDAAHPSDGGQQWYDEKLVEPAIMALRAALAQQAEPQDAELSAALGWPGGISEPVLDRKVLLQKVAALAQQAEPGEPAQKPITRLFGTLPVHDAQQAEPVEPVAWAFRHSDGTYHDPSVTEHSAGMVPLYPPPPQRKPLTKEEIDALPWNGSPRQFARAVERALEEKNRGR